MWIRLISYRITDERLGEVGKVYRLATTLLNPRVAPAQVLLELYHERWEVELVLDEIKTHERENRKVLRSKTPNGVIQEMYGIFLAHYAIRFMMAQAAYQADVDPDRVSFTRGMFELVEMISFSLTLSPEAAPRLVRRLYWHITRELLPPRVLRVNRTCASSRLATNTNPRNMGSLHQSPLSRRIGFLTLSNYLTLWAKKNLKKPKKEGRILKCRPDIHEPIFQGNHR